MKSRLVPATAGRNMAARKRDRNATLANCEPEYSVVPRRPLPSGSALLRSQSDPAATGPWQGIAEARRRAVYHVEGRAGSDALPASPANDRLRSIACPGSGSATSGSAPTPPTSSGAPAFARRPHGMRAHRRAACCERRGSIATLRPACTYGTVGPAQGPIARRSPKA